MTLVVALAAIWALVISRYGVAVPRMDQLNTPARQILAHREGTLDLPTLAAQHNESRKVVPSLLSLGLYELRGYYDQRAEMFLGWLLCVALVAAVARLGWLTTRRVDSTAILAALFAGLLWSRHTVFFHFFSVTFERLLPQLMILIAIATLYRRGPTWSAVVIASVACVISQYSYASGIISWALVLAFVLLSERSGLWRIRWSIGGFLVAAAFSSALYFRGYRQPSGHVALTSVLSESPGDILRFFLLFLGNGVTASHEPRTIGLGVLVLSGFVLLAVFALRGDPLAERVRSRLAWVVIGAYSLGQAALSTVGRLSMGIGNAVREDYVTHPIYLYISVVALGLLSDSRHTRRSFAIVGLLGAIISMTTVVVPAMARDVVQYSRAYRGAKACLLLAKIHEDPDCLDLIYPRVTGRAAVIERISPLLKQPLLDRIEIGPPVEGTLLGQYVEGAALVATGVTHSETDAVDAILVTTGGASSPRVVGVEPVGRKRPGAPRQVDGDLLPGGWIVRIPLAHADSQPCGFDLYAFDNERRVLRAVEEDGATIHLASRVGEAGTCSGSHQGGP